MIKIEYPKSLAHSLKLSDKDFENEIKISSLVKLFGLGKISSGTATNVLGISRIDFIELLSKYKVSLFSQYDYDNLRDDISNA
ncbi:UPF0175 family protein [Flavobacterium sp. CS20]|uniref:UPF0175 family protein n=1 Tax=Flavobacterium sp. CS20 TaxID=2775246 RepID=UPI001B39E6E3|nr:UPF0175 family protein [Flavobacterium sp. CS20]QTY27739.1 UPF0175 family protein [Flavobacterium sp. CS20]